MGIELTILLGLVIIAIAYFFFRKAKDVAILEDVVKTEQHVQITPEPIGGVPVVAVEPVPVEPAPVKPTPASTEPEPSPTVSYIPEVTQAVAEYVVEETKPVEAKLVAAKKIATKAPTNKKAPATKAKKKK